MAGGKKLVKAGFVYTLAGGVQKGIGFVVFMYLASILSVGQYALFGIYYAVYSAVATISFAGITESVVSLLNEYQGEDERKRLFRASGTVFLLLSLIGIVLIYLFQIIMYNEHYSNHFELFVILISSVLSSYYLFQSILVRFNEAHNESVIISFVPAVLGYLLGFGFAYMWRSSIAFYWGALIGHACGAVLYFFKEINFLGFSVDKADIKKLFVRLIPFSSIALISWFLGYGNTFVIDGMFEEEQVATYVFLYTIASIIQLIATSMNRVWSPRFYNEYPEADPVQLEKKYSKYTLVQGAVIGVSGFLIIALMPFAGELDSSLEIYVNTKMELFYLFAGYVVAIPWWHCQNYFFIENKGKELFRITGISGVLGFAAWYAAMKFIGIDGIYIGFAVNMLMRSILIYIVARKYWKMGFDLLGMLAGLIIMALVFII